MVTGRLSSARRPGTSATNKDINNITMNSTTDTGFLQSDQDMLFLGGNVEDSISNGDFFLGTSPMVTDLEDSDLFQASPERHNMNTEVMKEGSTSSGFAHRQNGSSPEESSDDSSSDDSARHERKSSSMSFQTSNDGDLYDPFKAWSDGNTLGPALSNDKPYGNSIQMAEQEMSNEDMEIHFDFKSAASSPRPHNTNDRFRGVSARATTEAKSDTSQRSIQAMTAADAPPPGSVKAQKLPKVTAGAKGRATVPATSDDKECFTSHADTKRHVRQTKLPDPLVQEIPTPPAPPCSLIIHQIPSKSRVETQIPMKLTILSLPERFKKLHLPTHTISKPKLIQRPKHERSPDTIELYSMLVCTSAMADEQKQEEILRRAASRTRGQEDRDSDLSPRTGPFEPDDPQSPLNGGEVGICSGCIVREKKRAARKKSKKPDEELAWAADEARRVIVFNTNEVRTLEEPEEDSDSTGPDYYGNERQMLPKGTKQIKMPMRIACYCRHHNEKAGFQVVLTLKDHQDNLLAQAISQPIMITDDHKAQPLTSTSITSSIPVSTKTKTWNDNELVTSGASPVHFGATLQRNAFSSNDLQAFNQQAHQQQYSRTGFRPFATVQTTEYNAMTPSRPGRSRQASPTSVGPVSKKRKASAGPKIPESLIMTKSSQVSPSQTNTTLPASTNSAAYPLSASVAASPFSPLFSSQVVQQPSHNPQRTPPYPSGPPTPDSGNNDLFSHVHRSQSFETNAAAQALFSQPPSTIPSRAPSPSSLVHAQANQGAMARTGQSQTFSLSQVHMQQRLPVINKLVPAQGPTAGGIEVTCLGSGFYQGIEVMFGDALATTTTYWGESTLVCLLPPSDRAGQVPVTMKHQHERICNVARQPVGVTFTYIDCAEEDMLRQALVIIGQRMTGRVEDAGDIVRQILSPGPSASTWHGYTGLEGQRHHMPMGCSDFGSNVNAEEMVLRCLDLVDSDEGLQSAQLDLPCVNGQTLLHLAASLGHRRLVAGLLARGADPNCRDRNGFTPLHMASLRGHAQVVRRLQFAGADPSLESYLGFRPVELTTDAQVVQTLRVPSEVVGPYKGDDVFGYRQQRSLYVDKTRTPSMSRSQSLSRYDASDELNDASSEDEGSEPSYPPDTMWQATQKKSISEADGDTNDVSSETRGLHPSPLTMMLAWRDQLAAQAQQFQQSFESLMPQLPIPILPTISPAVNLRDDQGSQGKAMIRKFGNLVPHRSPPSNRVGSGNSDQTDCEHKWWDIFSSQAAQQPAPPAYDEIYPQVSSSSSEAQNKSDRKSDIVSEMEFCDFVNLSSQSHKASHERSVKTNGQGNPVYEAAWDDFRGTSSQRKRLMSDRNLFFIWIPLFLALMLVLLKEYLPSPFVQTVLHINRDDSVLATTVQ